MSPGTTLVELLAELGGAELEVRRQSSLLSAAVLRLAGDRKVLFVERMYREGICVILDPAPEEVEIVRSGDLWQVWNSERAKQLIGAV